MPTWGSVFVCILLSYLLGSLSTGIIYSRWRGTDVRERDLPGGSGIYRQYGLWPALLVVFCDILKGVLAALLALYLLPQATWLAVLAVTLGHNYPIFFGWNGGGGIAPLMGALCILAPLPLVTMLGVALLFIPLYRRFLQPLVQQNAIPVATVIALPVGLCVAAYTGGLLDIAAGALVMIIRAFQIFRL